MTYYLLLFYIQVIPHEQFTTPGEGQISSNITFNYDSLYNGYVS